MGDKNPIRTLEDYSKPSHEGYRNTIELPVESLSEAWTHFKDLHQKVPHHGIDLWLQVQIFYDHVNPVTRRTIDQSAGGKLRDLNAEESWALLEDLALYDNKSWNDLRDFAKPVKAIALPQDVPINKITTLCEICSGPHDTQYCIEDPEQAFVEYTSSRTDEAGEGLVSEFMASQDARLSKFEANFKRQQGEMTNKINIVLKAITDQITGTLPSDMVRKLNSMLESLGLVPQSSNTKFVCSKEDDGEVMFIEIIRDDDEPQNEGLNEGEGATTEE
ncbi:hypothetical protein Tco_0764291 [Tanacetum coccineum]